MTGALAGSRSELPDVQDHNKHVNRELNVRDCVGEGWKHTHTHKGAGVTAENS